MRDPSNPAFPIDPDDPIDRALYGAAFFDETLVTPTVRDRAPMSTDEAKRRGYPVITVTETKPAAPVTSTVADDVTWLRAQLGRGPISAPTIRARALARNMTEERLLAALTAAKTVIERVCDVHGRDDYQLSSGGA
jgi:hypothetical protein